MSPRIEELYLRFGAVVYRRCLSVLKNEDAAYDALQDVFVKLMDSPEIVERMESPVRYLYRMATNVSLNHLKKRRGRAEGPVLLEELPDLREDGLGAAMLLELLAKPFSERTRAIVYHRYVDGMGLDEIAEQVELSLSAVRKHLDKFKAHARKHKERIL